MSYYDALDIRVSEGGVDLVRKIQQDGWRNIIQIDIGNLNAIDIGDVKNRRDGIYEYLDTKSASLVACGLGVGAGTSSYGAASCENSDVGQGGIVGIGTVEEFMAGGRNDRSGEGKLEETQGYEEIGREIHDS